MANRLADETSPYLLQHKDNPVDWYPWSDEALARAKDEDKPLLISIGYAACHWCHVMERESFEDPEIARQMNEGFVSIKVDREERPDIDAVYMSATQALTGSGGWPMTVFATPEGVPFLAGTYFPPADRGGMPGFPRVLEQVTNLWATRRSDLLTQGRRILESIERSTPASSSEPLQANLLLQGTTEILSTHDSRHGGFGRAPKFPQAPVLELLLRMSGKVPQTNESLQRTLRAMAMGGIYDQLGGGFARYATDEAWTVPHFEKMLYDNAQLARVYTHAWQSFDDPLYRRIAIESLDYLLYDMRDEAGGFHSSEDADSEGEEGTFYVWTREEVADIAPEAAAYYGLDGDPNFEGRYVLTAASPEPPQQARERLLVTRGRRVRPGRDDKVLTSWNGLAISALAEAGSAFGRPDFVEAAAEAAAFLLDTMVKDDRLLHTYRAGKAHVPGFCEDYAYFAEGLLALWESTFDQRWLDAAHGLARQALDLFADPSGGFFTTASDTTQLVVRQKEIIESATPAPGGVLAQVLQKLAVLFDDRDLERPAVDALRVAHAFMERAAQAVPTWMCALDFYVSTPTEVAFTGDITSDAGKALLEEVNTRFLPNRVLAAGSSDGIALLRDKPEGDRPLAYVCERYVCKQPTSDPGELAQLLSR